MEERTIPRAEQAADRLQGLYRQYGYLPYKMSKFEEYDLYVRNKSFLNSPDILTFTDLDGKLMALKPDVTLSILKNSRPAPALQKVFYQENVYRTGRDTRNFREILQMGLECIGPLDGYAEAEVLEVAVRSLDALAPEWLLDISHLGVVNGLLAALGLPAEEERRLLEALGEKNTPRLTELCLALGVADAARDRLCRLALLYDTPAAALPQLEALAAGSDAAMRAVEELRALCELLTPWADRLRLDFSLVSDRQYYSGVVFRGFVPGLPVAVLSGGRYDHLLARMGRRGGAVGFAVYLDQLDRLAPQERPAVDVLLLYGPDTPAAGLAAEARRLRAQGKTVRVEREAPEGLTFGQVCRMGG